MSKNKIPDEIRYRNLARKYVDVVCEQLTLLAHKPQEIFIHGVIEEISRSGFCIKVSYTLSVFVKRVDCPEWNYSFIKRFDGETFTLKIDTMDFNMTDTGVLYLEHFKNYMI